MGQAAPMPALSDKATMGSLNVTTTSRAAFKLSISPEGIRWMTCKSPPNAGAAIRVLMKNSVEKRM
jgi:hypothetical protein